MATGYRSDQRELGDVIVQRLATAGLGGEAKRAAAVFKTGQAELAEASDAALALQHARDEALAAVSKADAQLDAQLKRLADKLVGESLGKRTNPFAAFGAPSPSDICNLGYGKQTVEVRKLVRAIERSKPPAALVRAAAAVTEAGTELQKALDRYERPQAQYARALAKRDALLPSWQKALDRTRILARAALIDAPEQYKALFAPPGLSRPKRRKTSKTKKKSAQPTV